MDVAEALRKRKSVRAFLDREPTSDQIARILDAARHAPSGANVQPWQVAVVGGERKRKLQDLLLAEFATCGVGEMDYQYYPRNWRDPYKSRRIACGVQLYGTLGIKRQEKERRREQWMANYRAFDAPVALFFFMDSGLATGSFLDFGMFLQSLMLAAVEEGLATCPQAALGQYPEIIKRELGYALESTLVGGMALGFEDTAAVVNSYRTPRESVETFTRFFR